MKNAAKLAALSIVLGVFPFVTGVLLEYWVSFLFGDWLSSLVNVSSLAIGALQGLAWFPGSLLLAWLCSRILEKGPPVVAVSSVLVGTFYYLVSRWAVDTLFQVVDPIYAMVRLSLLAGIVVSTWRVAGSGVHHREGRENET